MQGSAQGLEALNHYGERLATQANAQIPDGTYRFEDCMDDDGQGNLDIPIRVRIEVSRGMASVDFAGTAGQVSGNINCPLAVAAAAVLYVFRCLMPAWTPACAGSFRPVSITAPEGCLLNARYPAAVAAGNVETSTRVVDVVMGALAKAVPERIPAASHGSMNNGLLRPWQHPSWAALGLLRDHRRRHGGGRAGRGAVRHPDPHDQHAQHADRGAGDALPATRVTQYGLRRGSGGAGQRRGGDGLVRELEFLAPASVSLLTERRRHRPWGCDGGFPGEAGLNLLNGKALPAKTAFEAATRRSPVHSRPRGRGLRSAWE